MFVIEKINQKKFRIFLTLKDAEMKLSALYIGEEMPKEVANFCEFARQIEKPFYSEKTNLKTDTDESN